MGREFPRGTRKPRLRPRQAEARDLLMALSLMVISCPSPALQPLLPLPSGLSAHQSLIHSANTQAHDGTASSDTSQQLPSGPEFRFPMRASYGLR